MLVNPILISKKVLQLKKVGKLKEEVRGRNDNNAKMLTPSKKAMCHPRCFLFAKSSGCESPSSYLHPCNESSLLQRKNKNSHGYQKQDSQC
jgi:hypothetical protein